VLIHDAQYTPEENRDRRGWGHSDYQAAFELAKAAGVKKLILFHPTLPASILNKLSLPARAGSWPKRKMPPF
jgi:ribonuclease BN (tRNA processing enzyme)